jgi:TetR/AcrR family transcriptional regulator, mexJK operon transcriptional repressor
MPAETRERLLEAATKAFMEEGYRASIDRIAARAGVAKQTFYNHFAGKDQLFGEVARRAAAPVLLSLEGGDGGVREHLLRFAAAIRGRLLGADGLAMFRALIGEVDRFPALVKSFLDHGLNQAVKRLAGYFRAAMAQGLLRKDDPVFAAEMFLSMLTGVERTRRLCGQAPLSPRDEARRTARIVDCFLGTYAPGGRNR